MDQDKKYLAYITSKEWFYIKIDIIQNRGCKCEICGKGTSPNRLQLHHLTYRRLYNENASDLQLLCNYCHLNAHGLIKIKVKIKKKKTKKPKSKTMLLGRDKYLQKRYDAINKKNA